MDSGQGDHYDTLIGGGGNRQYTGSPFAFDWRPYISCHFGWRVHPITGEEDNHLAVDISVPYGTEIIAAHDGTVTIATSHSSYGNYIALDSGEGIVTKYAHCSRLLVSAGTQVKAGDVIALVGSTGDSTGNHLHFEVIVNGQHMNPVYFAENTNQGG
ncbi:M23 family metallopeptidase [Clostridia bacterium OttesenSCG-928-O13]|nr:M23 family metallopeptidase [Clostridia bacterium OttesenSCG-928-O13]